ncbi:unnamed protein product [Boreogadus saida]
MADSELWVLRRVRSEFIQRVSDPVIKGLLVDLTDHKVFSTEEKDSVMEEKSRADRAQRLVDMVMVKGERASLMMINSMKKRDKHLSITLGLISSPAGDLKAVPSKKVKLKRLFSRARDKKTRFAGQDLSDEQLLQVAKTLGQEWEQAALHLGLKIKDLDDIKAEHRPVAMQKQKLKMLVLWKRRRPPGEATAEDLLRGLEDMEDLPVETRLLLTVNQEFTRPGTFLLRGPRLRPSESLGGRERGEEYRRSGGRQPPRTMRPADYALVSGGKRPQYIAPIAMRISADLCSEVNGEGNDPEVDGPKRQEARVQEEGHGLLLSPRQANKPEWAW